MKRLFLFLILSCVLAPAAWSELLVYEGFAPTDSASAGDWDGGTGFAPGSAWGVGANPSLITSASNQAYTFTGSSSQHLTVSGHAAQMVGTAGSANGSIVYRLLGNGGFTSGTVYLAFLGKVTVNNGHFMGVRLSYGGGSSPAILSSQQTLAISADTGGHWALTAGNGGSAASTTASATTLSLIVAKITINGASSSVTLYINPTSSVESGNTPAVSAWTPSSFGTGTASLSFDTLMIGAAGVATNTNPPEAGIVDELRVGNTFADVVPVSPALAAYGAWTPSYIGGGGWLQNVVIAPSNPSHLYTYVDMAGIYGSTDGGNTWQKLTGGLPGRSGDYEVRTLWVDPVNENTVLAAMNLDANGHSVYRSTDGGTTWSAVSLPSSAPFYGNGNIYRTDGSLIIHRPGTSGSTATLLIASQGGGLFKSTDGGATWAASNSGLPTDLPLWSGGMQVMQSSPDKVLLWTRGGTVNSIACKGGLYVTTNFGGSWSLVTAASPNHVIQDSMGTLWATFNYGGSNTCDNQLIDYSVDGGYHWTALTTGLAVSTTAQSLNSNCVYNALAAPSGSVVIASGTGTFYKRNAGDTTASWSALSHTASSGPYPWAKTASWFGQSLGWITVDPSDTTRWFCTDWYAAWHSSNSGAAWSLCIPGIEDTYLLNITPDPGNPNLVHAGTSDNGYLRSNCGGLSFLSAYNPSTVGDMKCVDVSPHNPSYVVGVGAGGWTINQVYYSSDKGLTWTLSPMTGLPGITAGVTAMPGNTCNSITVNPYNSQDDYLTVSGTVASGNGGPYHSIDGGKTWTWMGSGLPNAAFFTSSMWANNGHEIVMGEDGTLLCAGGATTQSVYKWNGTQWTSASSGLPLPLQWINIVLAPDLQTPGCFYAACWGKGLYRTLDDGATWTQISATRATYVTCDPNQAGRIAFTDNTTVWYSTNADNATVSAIAWTNLDPSGSLPWQPQILVAIAGPNVLAGTAGGGIFSIAPGF